MFQINQHETVVEDAYTRYQVQNEQFQTMTYTPIKFQSNQSKTVVDDAYTGCLVSILFGRKNYYVHFVQNVTKDSLKNMSKQYAHLQTMT